MSLFDAIKEGVKAVAPMAADAVIPGSGSLIEGLMRRVTGDSVSDIEQVAAQIHADPTLMVELQKAALEQEKNLAEIEARKLETVNVTMRAETVSEKWQQYSWRPWNGFTYPVAVMLIYVLLPMCGKPVPEVPQWIWIGWLSILGVATWDRGKAKRAAAGEVNPGIIARTISAIRGANG